MEKFFAFVGSQILTLLIGLLLFALLTYVIYDIALLFGVEIIHRAPYMTLFGLVLIAKLLYMKGPKITEIETALEKEGRKISATFQLDMIRSLAYTVSILVGWFSAYLAHWIWF